MFQNMKSKITYLTKVIKSWTRKLEQPIQHTGVKQRRDWGKALVINTSPIEHAVETLWLSTCLLEIDKDANYPQFAIGPAGLGE